MSYRYNAFLMHLAVSLAVLMALYGVTRIMWYPSYLYELDGAFEAVSVVFCVCLLVGPVLTLIVYRPGKKKNRFDMVCVVLIQILSLGYGIHLLYLYRPLALVVYGNSFYSITADVYANYSIQYSDYSSIESKSRCGIGCYIIKNTPESRTSVITTGTPARVRQEFYTDYADAWASYAERPSAFFSLGSLGEEEQSLLKAEASGLATMNHDIEEGELGLMPVYGRYLEGFFIVDKSSGEVLGFVDQKLPIVSDT